MILLCAISRFIRVNRYVENVSTENPNVIRYRASTLPISRPTIIIETIAPTPRGLTANPLSTAG